MKAQLAARVPQFVADRRVGDFIDDLFRLGVRVTAPDGRRALLADDAAVLEGGDWAGEPRNHGGHVGLGVPGRQSDDRPVRSSRTRGLRSIQSYSSGVPNANDAVTGISGASAPDFSSARTPSLNISDQTDSPRRPVSAASTASGMVPIPSCSVAPSGTCPAARSPMAWETSGAVRSGGDGSGVSASIA